MSTKTCYHCGKDFNQSGYKAHVVRAISKRFGPQRADDARSLSSYLTARFLPGDEADAEYEELDASYPESSEN